MAWMLPGMLIRRNGICLTQEASSNARSICGSGKRYIEVTRGVQKVPDNSSSRSAVLESLDCLGLKIWRHAGLPVHCIQFRTFNLGRLTSTREADLGGVGSLAGGEEAFGS